MASFWVDSGLILALEGSRVRTTLFFCIECLHNFKKVVDFILFSPNEENKVARPPNSRVVKVHEETQGPGLSERAHHTENLLLLLIGHSVSSLT